MLGTSHIWCQGNFPKLLLLAVPWPRHPIHPDGHLLEPSQLRHCRALIECPCRESATTNPLPRVLHLQCSLYLDVGGAGMEPDGMAEKESKGFAKASGQAARLLFFATAVSIRHPA